MPKHEPMTPKAIGKAIKSKGLQKLKFFCQMCQKQCRDANGFKCHITSEAHQRQLLLFAENPGKYLDGFSGEFLKDYLYLLRTRFGTRRVHANQVYQEYIKDRNHVHMNSTRWLSLTGLSKWLGRKGFCEVDHTEKGWFITYIDRDPETMKKQENAQKKVKMEKDYEERMAKIIADQVERGKQMELARQAGREAPTGYESNGESDSDDDDDRDDHNDGEQGSSSSCSTSQAADFKRTSEEQRITFALPAPVGSATSKVLKLATNSQGDNGISERISNPLKECKRKRRNSGESGISTMSSRSSKSQKSSALDEFIEDREREKDRTHRKDYWLTPEIVVKVISKRVPEQYYKQKGTVVGLIDRYRATIEIGGDQLKVDQSHVETVIPKPGSPIMVVNGAYRGCRATLIDVNFDQFSTTIRIDSGPTRDRVVSGVRYEDICKMVSSSSSKSC